MSAERSQQGEIQGTSAPAAGASATVPPQGFLTRLLHRSLRLVFVLGIAWPIARLWLGLIVRNKQRLPSSGPAIVIANHNSHLDVLVLISLFPLSRVLRVQPAAAADYFLSKGWLAWFTLNLVGIVPVTRGGGQSGQDPLQSCVDALAAGQILLIFPEGTRGKADELSEIKSGLWFLSEKFPTAPIVPIYMDGLGRAMAKGHRLPVPFFVNIIIDEPIPFDPDRKAFKDSVKARFVAMQAQLKHREFGDDELGQTEHPSKPLVDLLSHQSRVEVEKPSVPPKLEPRIEAADDKGETSEELTIEVVESASAKVSATELAAENLESKNASNGDESQNA